MKRWRSLLFIALILLAIYFISGNRFTAIGAAEANDMVTGDLELLEQHETGASAILLYKSDDKEEYRTVLVEKSGLFFRSSASTYIPYRSDKVQTVGGMSFTSEHDAMTYMSVVSNDMRVAYIEAGIEKDRKRKKVQVGQRVSFLFPNSQPIEQLDAKAIDENGQELYYYGYPAEAKNIFDDKDLKWHKSKD